jgi:hypothetical protein
MEDGVMPKKIDPTSEAMYGRIGQIHANGSSTAAHIAHGAAPCIWSTLRESAVVGPHFC